MEILSYIKDMLLDYANKKAELKSNGESKDKYEALDKQFVSNMMVLRDRFPEYLFINYSKDITEEEAKEVFKKIKSKVSNCYSISYFPMPQYLPVNIDGVKMEIPGILPIEKEDRRCYVIKYLDNEKKNECINLFLLHLLISFPIKKIKVNFVDLAKRFDYRLLIQNLPTTLYNEKPIQDTRQFYELMDRLEKRRIEFIRKYGDYSDYCKEHNIIPEPYEIVIIYDDCLEEECHKMLDALLDYSLSIGVFVIISSKTDKNNYFKSIPCKFDEEKCRLYVYENMKERIQHVISLPYTGLSNDYSLDKSNDIGSVKAPLPGIITEINVVEGQHIIPGDDIAILESMQMQNNLFAERYGVVISVLVNSGDQVMEDDDIVLIDYSNNFVESNSHIQVGSKKSQIAIPIEHYENPINDGIINFTPITNNEILLKACFDYIRTEAEAREEMKVEKLDFDSAAESKYERDLSTMIIPVGKADSKNTDFRMDLVSHVHSFIIGQSGSGKSVFLHNIIGGAMLKYAPEDLQLYLLDFKLGGVEFNRYKGAKHVKALLVDNSDSQVTLEILRELRNSMTERGKLLRNAGVNNIGEYNKIHQGDRMSHVLVVADECHEMFKADDSIPRQVRNEISDIVIKIAKEGRSQGVHLVFATQTLSGTEISSEIINNVSDFYLLKCAQTDSERLVPNSSAITSELSTGQIYYYHVDEHVKFQAYYTDKEAAEKLMVAIVEKAKDHKSNGEFYFNGAQMFYLDEAVKEVMLNVKCKSPVAFMGKAIDISQKDLYIKLNEDFSENVLLLGLNDQEQVTRTTMNLFVSLLMSAKLKHKDIAFKVIDCLNNEEGEVHELIFDLESEGYCDIIERRQRNKFFKELAQSVQSGTAEETILLILGQDRFRELKMDMELEESNSSKSSDNDDMMSISDDFFGGDDNSSSNVRTYREALNVILDKGPDYGVHTLLQIEKASNLLFEDYITPKVVFQKFKHLVMLKADETAGVTLHLNDDIRLEKLSSDWERLRAYYYAEESDSYTLFTPYMPSKSKDIINTLKIL